MSGTMNIAGLTPVDDPAYRYKMPRLMAKVEGRGNGIKTLLVNVGVSFLSLLCFLSNHLILIVVGRCNFIKS